MNASALSGKIGAAASQAVTVVSDIARATAKIVWTQAAKVAHVAKYAFEGLGKASVSLYGQGKHAVFSLFHGAQAHPAAAAAILVLAALSGAAAYALKDRCFSV